MIAIDDTYLSITDAAKFIPTRPHSATVWRWAIKGIKGVKLETVMVGGQRFTTEEAINDFLKTLNGRPIANRSGRAKQLAATNKELDAELA